jgi:hypothetical protein
MAFDEYRDFVLILDAAEVSPQRAIQKISVQVFDSPVGQGEMKEIVTLPDDLLTQLRWLESNSLDDDLEAQIKLGEVLAGLLLPEYARRLYGASLARLKDNQGLRLRLRLADELANIPWELAYIQDARGERDASGFLALDPRLSIARHEALAVPGDWFEAPTSRRVVVAMASPEGHPRLRSLPEEQRKLRQTLEGVPGIQAVFVPEDLTGPSGVEQGATPQSLLLALMERTDVFHFSGHGMFEKRPGQTLDSVVGQGSLLLASDGNQPFAFPAQKLAELLRSKGVRLVVLGACETGRRDGVNVWSGVAAAMLREGIPAVVAMQYEVLDVLAAAFDGAFYRALVAGLIVDEAVALGRTAMRVEAQAQGMADIPDWCVPVLYLRSPGGAVFNRVNDTAAADAAEQFLGDLFQFKARRVEASGRVVGALVGGLQTQDVKVQQKVDEEMAGVMIGAARFGQQQGRLVVEQEVDTVSGILIGGITGGGGDQAQALNQLKAFLGQASPAQPAAARPAAARPAASPAGGMTCPTCGTLNSAEANFCFQCGQKLGAETKFCIFCAQELPGEAQYCTRCGRQQA